MSSPPLDLLQAYKDVNEWIDAAEEVDLISDDDDSR